MGTNKGTPFENKDNSLLMIFISIFEIEMIDIYIYAYKGQNFYKNY